MKNKAIFSIVAAMFISSASFATTYTLKRTTVPSLTVSSDELMVEDQYSVIKVNGQIVYVRSGSDMATGDVFEATEKLDFKTTESRAAVISELKGRFILTASESGDDINLGPAMNNISSRAGALLNMIDLQNHFKNNYLIIDRLEVEIGDKAFPQDDNNFFFIMYKYNGEEIPKMLAHNGNKLIIDKDELFKVDGTPIAVPAGTEMQLWYMESAKEQTTFVSEFVPVFPDADELQAEVAVIIRELSDGKDYDTKVSEINAYLTEFYGKAESEHLEAWLNANFEL